MAVATGAVWLEARSQEFLPVVPVLGHLLLLFHQEAETKIEQPELLWYACTASEGLRPTLKAS